MDTFAEDNAHEDHCDGTESSLTNSKEHQDTRNAPKYEQGDPIIEEGEEEMQHHYGGHYKNYNQSHKQASSGALEPNQIGERGRPQRRDRDLAAEKNIATDQPKSNAPPIDWAKGRKSTRRGPGSSSSSSVSSSSSSKYAPSARRHLNHSVQHGGIETPKNPLDARAMATTNAEHRENKVSEKYPFMSSSASPLSPSSSTRYPQASRESRRSEPQEVTHERSARPSTNDHQAYCGHVSASVGSHYPQYRSSPETTEEDPRHQHGSHYPPPPPPPYSQRYPKVPEAASYEPPPASPPNTIFTMDTLQREIEQTTSKIATLDRLLQKMSLEDTQYCFDADDRVMIEETMCHLQQELTDMQERYQYYDREIATLESTLERREQILSEFEQLEQIPELWKKLVTKQAKMKKDLREAKRSIVQHHPTLSCSSTPTSSTRNHS